MSLIANNYGLEIDFEKAVELMDPQLRQELYEKLSPCGDQEFFQAYAKAHMDKFGESWSVDTEKPPC